MKILCYAASAALLLCAFEKATVSAAEWSQYRGPTHDGISSEDVTLPVGGVKPIWKVETTNGFSSFAVGDGAVFTIVGRNDNGNNREVCIALNSRTGKELWAVETGTAKYQGGGDSGAGANKGGDGPRSTPAYSDGHVYVYSGDLVLICLDAKTGRMLWHIDMIKEHGGKNIAWSNAMSPVIDGDLIFVAAGGSGESLLGINTKTGNVVWKSGSEKITHAAPVVANLLGQRQVIFFVQSGLVSVVPTTGKELWRYKFDYSTSTAASPVVCGDIVYCSAGYNIGGGACKIAKSGDEWTATEIWRIKGNREVANHWSTPVYKDGYLYGLFSFKKYGDGPMKCVEVATGKVMWEHPGFGAGQVILAHDKVLALADDGELVVVDPKPDGYKEISRAQAIEGKCWSTPALSDGKVYIRSTKEGACFDLSGK